MTMFSKNPNHLDQSKPARAKPRRSKRSIFRPANLAVILIPNFISAALVGGLLATSFTHHSKALETVQWPAILLMGLVIPTFYWCLAAAAGRHRPSRSRIGLGALVISAFLHMLFTIALAVPLTKAFLDDMNGFAETSSVPKLARKGTESTTRAYEFAIALIIMMCFAQVVIVNSATYSRLKQQTFEAGDSKDEAAIDTPPDYSRPVDPPFGFTIPQSRSKYNRTAGVESQANPATPASAHQATTVPQEQAVTTFRPRLGKARTMNTAAREEPADTSKTPDLETRQ